MEVFFIIIGMIFVIIIIRLVAGVIDRDRVEQYISEQGGKVIDKKWNPFGKGWFGSQNERIYEVRYVDKGGNIHRATCKTSMLAGVYFTQDKIIEYAEQTKYSSRTDLEEENRRLKQQVEDLKRNS